MNETINEMIFGRPEITTEERAWLKHSVVGATLWMPGGIYGSEWKGEGLSPAQKYLELFRGKGDEKFAEFKAAQQAKENRKAARQTILEGIDSQHSWKSKLFEKLVAAIILLDHTALAEGWDWDDKFFGENRIEAALEEAQCEYENAKRDAEEMEDSYAIVKFRGMQVVLFNKDGRVGDPIDYPACEPYEIEIEQVRNWIADARKAGATGVELQGGFDGATNQGDMDAGNYDPEITSFEVTLWKEKE